MSDQATQPSEQTEVKPGSEEYNKEMAEKFQQGHTQSEEQPTQEEVPIQGMPEGGHDKFYNKETGEYDWKNHAKELQYKIDQSNTQTTPEQQPQQNAETKNEAETEQQAVDSIIARAGLQNDNLRSQLENNGDFDEPTYEALQKVGIPKDIVETYVENIKFRRDRTVSDALEYVGGEDAWRNMNQWAVDNLPQEEISKFNELLASDQWKIGVDAMKVRMGSNTFEPKMTTGNQLPGTTYGYKSKSEMKADMSNPKYQSDPSFRKEVMRKMQSATWDNEE